MKRVALMSHNADVTRFLDERSKKALAAVEVQRKHPVAESGERCPTKYRY